MEPFPEDEFILDENELTTRNQDLDLDEDSDVSDDENADDDKNNEGGMKEWFKENKKLVIGIGSGILAIGATVIIVHQVKKSKRKKELQVYLKSQNQKKWADLKGQKTRSLCLRVEGKESQVLKRKQPIESKK